ncbi:MAG TPA: hypothetical protein VKC54_04800 [Patescibacteria group bacterium]|nr:hypothetical protein [Patescibacteria group bacterium]
MSEKLTHGIPNDLSPWLDTINNEAYFRRYPLKEGPVFTNEVRIMDKIAGPVIERALKFEENAKKSGLVVAIAHRGGVYQPPVAVRYGQIEAEDDKYGGKLNKYTYYALLKTQFLIRNPEFKASIENLKLPENKIWKIDENSLPGGSIAFKNGIILGISGLATGEQDSAVVLAIGVAAHLVRRQVATKMARNLGFLSEYHKFI